MDTFTTKLILSIVERGHGEPLVDAAKQAGARGGTILLGRGTAAKQILQILGLGDSRKDVVLTLVPGTLLAPVLDAIAAAPRAVRKMRGVSMVLDVNTFIRRSAQSASLTVTSSIPHAEQGATMPASTRELISIIVNAGYADDVMAAARKAGAPGGTIINARGTGREEDVTFFGVTLVPEKELLLILATREQCPAILEAVRNLPCLSEPGMGIAFCMDVERFLPLGDTAADK